MDPKTEKVDLGQRNVLVRELTPRELDTWMGEEQSGPEYPRIIDMLYAERLLSGDVILLATDLTADELLDLPPHATALVCAKIRELNPFFARLLDRIATQQGTSAKN